MRKHLTKCLLVCVVLPFGMLACGEESLDDGPYVFWRGADSVEVVYFCDHAMEVTPFTVDNTLRFTGLCQDSTVLYTIAAEAPMPVPTEYDSVSEILALSDIHGEYDHLAEILQVSGVIDDVLHWNWGTGHLVIDGDVFDRGDQVTECLWLIHRLEREAAAAGGAVHFLLGNHELMVLRGDLRYVDDKYVKGNRENAPWTYDELYGPTTELGRWLRRRNSIVRLNDVLFVHGGLIPSHLIRYGGIDRLNDLIRAGLDVPRENMKDNDTLNALYGRMGPFWFRGYFNDDDGRYEPATEAQIDSVLRLCNVDQIVVGHTEQDSLSTLCDGRVVAIDVDVEALGGFQALLWQDGVLWRVNKDGGRAEL